MPKRRALLLVVSAVGRFALSLFLIGFVTSCLLRLAPGFGTDERELDPRFSNESIERLKTAESRGNVFAGYGRFLQEASHGNFGFSMALQRPVQELIQQRYATSIRILTLGLLAGWASAFLFAATGAVMKTEVVQLSGTLAGGSILCVPSALLAYVCYLAGAPAFLVVALVVFARLYRVLSNFFRSAREHAYAFSARAQGLSELRIFTRHILSATSTEIVALVGASVSMAVGATIAAEAFCGEPGLGQLVWKAALSRDLSLLVSLTLVIATVTLLSNRAADVYVQLRRSSV